LAVELSYAYLVEHHKRHHSAGRDADTFSDPSLPARTRGNDLQEGIAYLYDD
jgi:hypothetical protein